MSHGPGSRDYVRWRPDMRVALVFSSPIGDDRPQFRTPPPPQETFAMTQTSNSFVILSACTLALGLTLSAVPGYAVAQTSVIITVAPPALPVYEQPVLV